MEIDLRCRCQLLAAQVEQLTQQLAGQEGSQASAAAKDLSTPVSPAPLLAQQPSANTCDKCPDESLGGAHVGSPETSTLGRGLLLDDEAQ